MKKHIILMSLITFLLTVENLNSQVKSTRNSYVTPNSSVIRALVLFAEIDYTAPSCNTVCGDWSDYWETVGGVTSVPSWANQLFDSELDPGEKPSKYLSKYYYEASFGEYTILGDYYDKVLKIPCTGLFCGDDGINEALSILDLEPTQITKNGYSMSDFDMWDLASETESSLRGGTQISGF